MVNYMNWTAAFGQSPELAAMAAGPDANPGLNGGDFDIAIGNQVQDITVANGLGNTSGAIEADASQQLDFEGPGVSVSSQTQIITAGNGAYNSVGPIEVENDQRETTVSDGPFNETFVDVNVDVSDGVRVDMGLQVFAIGNGYMNTVGGEGDDAYTPMAEDFGS